MARDHLAERFAPTSYRCPKPAIAGLSLEMDGEFALALSHDSHRRRDRAVPTPMNPAISRLARAGLSSTA